MASVLLTKGRLPFPQIVRLASLKPRTARASILVLIQHNLLWHSKGDDGREVFEINTDECIMRLRFGYFIWLSDQLYGALVRILRLASPLVSLMPSQAARIVSLILDHGKLRSADIISRLSAADAKSKSNISYAGTYPDVQYKKQFR